MSFTVEKSPDAPILVMVHKNGTFKEEFEPGLDALMAALDAQPEPVYLVLDIAQTVMSLDEMTYGASVIARSPRSLMHHPKVLENLVISHDGMLKLAAAGLRTGTFGNVKIRIFETLEQALDYCHERIAEKVRR